MKPSRRRLLLLLLLAVGLLALSLLPFLSRRTLETRLTAAMGRPASVGGLRYRLAPLGIEITDLRIAGPTPEAPPLLEVPLAEVVPSLPALWSRQLALARLRLVGPRMRVHFFGDGSNDLPVPASGAGAAGVAIRRLVIEAGELELDHDRVPLQLDLPDVSGRLARHAGSLAGTLSFGPGRAQFGAAPPLDASVELELALQPKGVEIQRLRLRTPGTALAGKGRLSLAPEIAGSFDLEGAVALDEADRSVLQTGLGLSGTAHFAGQWRIEAGSLGVAGRVNGGPGRVAGIDFARFAGQLTRDAKGVELRQLEVSALGGSALLDLAVPAAPAEARLAGRLSDVDLESSLETLFGLGRPGVDAAANGDVSLRWPRGQIRRASGSMQLELHPRGDARTPLSGRLEWSADNGDQRIAVADLKTPAAWARLSGAVDAQDQVALNLEASSSDLAAGDELLARLRRAFGGSAATFGLGGSGSFHGRWEGTLRSPVLSGRFTGADVSYLGVNWGRLEWAGVADPNALAFHSLVLRRGSSELWLDGRLETGIPGTADALDLRVRLGRWPAADFRAAFGWDVPLNGELTGDATLAGRRSAPLGSARLAVAAGGDYAGVRFRELAATLAMDALATHLSQGHVRLGQGGAIEFSGSLGRDDEYEAAATLTDIELSDVLPAPWPGGEWGGSVSGQIRFGGKADAPRLEASFDSHRVFLGEEGLGALKATLHGSGDGHVAIDAQCRSPRVDLKLTGDVAARAPHRATLQLVASETSLDPFVREWSASMPSALGLVVSGTAAVEGPLDEPAQLEADITLPTLALQLPEYPVRNAAPIDLRVEAGRLVVRSVRLAGEGTDLAVTGAVGLEPAAPMALSVDGGADLRALSFLSQRLRGRGAARLQVSVAGARQAPHIKGQLEIDGAGLRVRDFPQGLEEVRGRVAFSEKGASFEGVTAKLGGGDVELGGQVSYTGAHLDSFDVHGNGRSVALRYPEGLRSVVDADLRAFGDADSQWLTGTLDVGRAVWTRRYDVASELLGTSGATTQAPSLAPEMRLDVKLRAPGTLRIDNNLATLVARAELTLSGTSISPSLLGRVEVERGRVYFQGNTYVIRRGTLDFVQPHAIDPIFDIEAETRVQSYRVTLKVNGTLERVYPNLTSDPPLTPVQILSLLAGGDEQSVTSLTPSQAEQARLAATGAATLAAGRLSEEMGLERGAERLLGLNRFSIDPLLVRGGVLNPTARLTVGKRVTSDLTVLYSLDLRQAEDRVISIEYTLSDRLSVLLTQAEPGGVGFDIRLHHSRP